MPTLVGLHGHSGAGKTTAADHLAQTRGGQKIYLGGIVLEELGARGLERSPANELKVRFELREAYGDDYLLAHAEARIRRMLDANQDVFVDAVLSKVEWDRLCTFGTRTTLLLSISAPFGMRAQRLADRPDRPLDRESLIERDDAEGLRLGTGHLAIESTRMILNTGTEADFRRSLDEFASTLDHPTDVNQRAP